MRIRSRWASILFKVVLIAGSSCALIMQTELFEGHPSLASFRFFTNLSNLLIVLYFIGDVIYLLRDETGRAVTWRPTAKYATLMAITVTFLVAHFLLGGGLGVQSGKDVLMVVLLHYVTPILSIVDWLLFDEKGKMDKAGPLAWVVIPLVYFAGVLAAVNLFGANMGYETRYPYPFIDVDALGWGTVLLTVAALVVFFVVLGYAFYAIDRLLARIARRSRTSCGRRRPQRP